MGRRMERPSRAWEVTQIWGGNVQKSEVFAGTFEVGIGDEAGCDLPLALEGRHVLVRGDEMGAVLSAPRGATGVVATASGTIELHGDAAVDVPLGEDGRAILEVAGMELLVRATEAPEKIESAMPFSWRDHRFTAVSLGMHLAFLVGVLLVPPNAMSLSIDRTELRNRIAQVVLAPPEEIVPEWMTKVGPVQGTNEGQPASGDMGKAGDPNETHRNRQLQRRGPPDNPSPAISKLTQDQVRHIGIIGVLTASAVDLDGSIYGREAAQGRDPQTLAGNLSGLELGAANGIGGLGPIGTGRGGCPAGTPPALCAAGTVGVGTTGLLGTIGGCSAERLAALTREVGRARAVEMCSGGISGVGIGVVGGGRPRPSVVPGIHPLPVQLSGGLSKESIRRVVHQHMNEIRFCYEQGLHRQPDLAGRVSVGFTIRGDGGVLATHVAGSTLQSPSVESCMAGAVRRWAFPASPTGGATVVTYPFVVVPASEN